ncbi:hypothetical protein FACS1894110_06710 [Spirochaetia bacterium]|nr:hypothetical protein FACS1894110_06710 [Spirochaetia bacterium]
MKGKFPLKPLDFVVIGAALALTAFSAFMIYAKPQNTYQVMIQNSDKVWVFPLDAEETLTAPGPLGDTVIEIRDRRVRVLSSPCDNQTCVAAGHIDSNGQWVACLPNNVFVAIEGKDDIDGILDITAW